MALKVSDVSPPGAVASADHGGSSIRYLRQRDFPQAESAGREGKLIRERASKCAKRRREFSRGRIGFRINSRRFQI